MTEFRYSCSRLMSSPPGTRRERRTTKVPSGGAALKLRLVRPPASSTASTGRPRSTSIFSHSDRGSPDPPASTDGPFWICMVVPPGAVQPLDACLQLLVRDVDGPLRPGKPVLDRRVPVDPQQDHGG